MVRLRHCFYCGKPLSRRTGGKDHVVPRSKGGGDSKRNIVDACHKCNSEKGNLLPEEFRVVMAFRKGKTNAGGFKFFGEEF